MVISLLETARDRIARQLVRDNPAITDPDLNAAITSCLLQLLFLRTGQECGFVEPGTLAALAGCDGIVKRMGRACSDGGLVPEHFFEQEPGGAGVLAGIADESLHPIIRGLDRPEDPVFPSRLSAEDLAAVLDHVLGARMQIAEGYRAIRVGKSGLIYTGTVDVPPQSVVEYAVNTTLNCRAGNHAATGVVQERILDPACGTGIFLLGAYRYLVRKRTRHVHHPEELPGVLQDLITGSLFGTDIDPDTVSAARFVLLSGFISEAGRSASPVSPNLIRRVCASLAKTIRCGNALIEPDYFLGKPAFPFNAGERRKVNAFEWRNAFPGVLAEGGFDAVIGAPPPYRPFAVKAREEYFQTHYTVYGASAGLYGYFIEKGLSLLKPGGTLTVLVPGTFLRLQHARPLRRLLLTRQIEQIAATGGVRVLPEGEAMMYLLTLRNQAPGHPFCITFPGSRAGADRCGPAGRNEFTIDQCSLDDGGWSLDDTRQADLLRKLQKKGTLLDQYVLGEIDSGVHRIRNNPLVVDRETLARLTKNAAGCRRFFIPLLRPADIRRYLPLEPARWVIAAENPENLRNCRHVSGYLDRAVKKPETGRPGMPGEITLIHPRPEPRVPKIIFEPYQQIPAFCFDAGGAYALTATLCMIPRNDPYLAAILNSSLGRFIIVHTCPHTDRGYHTGPATLGKFPVMVPDFERHADKIRHKKIVAAVTRILSLQDYLPKAGSGMERRLVQQEIDATDVQIDALVYALYGLTQEETALVDEMAGRHSPS